MVWGRGPILCEYLVVPALFVEMTILFPSELSWHACWKSMDCNCEGLFLDSQFSSIICLSLCQFHTVLVTIVFEIKKYEISNFVFFFQDCFGYYGSLEFHMNLRISLSISTNKSAGIFILFFDVSFVKHWLWKSNLSLSSWRNLVHIYFTHHSSFILPLYIYFYKAVDNRHLIFILIYG